MLFDKFCSVVEQHFPELRGIAEQAKLFVFEKAPHLVLKKNAGADYREFENIFALPFRVTAIEDPASLIVLIDKEEDAVGFGPCRGFIELLPWNNDESAFAESNLPIRDMKRIMSQGMTLDEPSCFLLSIGEFSDITCLDSSVNVKGSMLKIIMGDKHKLHTTIVCKELPLDVQQTIAMQGIRNAVTAVEELLTLSSRTNFILEDSPARIKAQTKKIPRSHQRPKYTILSAKAIRSKLGLADPVIVSGSKKSPMPHERRRHLRRLSSDGGHFKESKVIVIPACWVGPSEKVVGRKIYKVRLDI